MTTVLQLVFKRSFFRQTLRWLVTIVVLAAVGGVAWFLWQRFSVPRLIVTEVVEGPVVQAFYATGTLLPHREYPVKSNVEGTIVEVVVDKGSEVEQGQMVAKVYVEEFLLKRTQAQAELDLKKQMIDPATSPTLLEFDAKIRAAEKQWETAKGEHERLAQIRDTGGRTLSDLAKADELVKTSFNSLAALKSAKASKQLELERDVKTTQAQLDIAKWNIDQQTITSPVAGVVLDWPVATGTRVKVNDVLMTVADVRYDKLVMRTNVDEEDKTRVKIDQTVQMTLYAYPDRVFEGRVKRIYPKADPSRRTFEVDVQLVRPEESFSAGMTGELAFIVDSKQEAIVIPSQSVQAGRVWVVRDGKLDRVEVQLGLKSIQRTEILSGLSPGDQVVVSPVTHMEPGRDVQTTYLDPAAAAGLNEPKTQAASNFKGFK